MEHRERQPAPDLARLLDLRLADLGLQIALRPQEVSDALQVVLQLLFEVDVLRREVREKARLLDQLHRPPQPPLREAVALAHELDLLDPDAWAFVHAQDEWDRHVTPWGPFGGLWYAIRALWRTNHNFTEHFYLVVNIESLVFLAFFIALIPLVWRHVGAAYAVFTAVVLAVPMSVPSDRGDFPLFSMPRFTILAFPCFIALAVIGRRASANTAIVAASSAMLGVAIVQWTLATLS